MVLYYTIRIKIFRFRSYSSRRNSINGTINTSVLPIISIIQSIVDITFNLMRISFFVRCINTEESVDLDSVSDFEDRDESEE